MSNFPNHRPIAHSFSTIVGLVAASVLFAGLVTCSQAWFIYETESLNERIDDTVLLAGCVIIEPEEYMYHPLNILFAYQQPGKNKLKSVWAKTDSLGYFILPNMPLGRYAINAVCQESPYSICLLVDDRYEDNKWLYGNRDWDFSPMPSYPHQWPEIQDGGIINFEYLILTYNRKSPSGEWASFSDWVKAYKRSLLTGDRFLSDYEYYRPSIPAYLLNKYPNSEWALDLRQLIKDQ